MQLDKKNEPLMLAMNIHSQYISHFERAIISLLQRKLR